MKKLFYTSALALIIFGTPIASAQNAVSMEETFDSILNAFATPAADVGTPVGDWDDIANIKGINWNWPRNQIADHDYTWQGTIGQNLEVEIQGARTYINTVSISFAINASHTEAIDINHFNPNQLTKITTTCDLDWATHQEVFYQWIKPGRTPLYIHYMSSFGTRSGNVDYKIGYVLDDILTGYPNSPNLSCEVLKGSF